MTTIVLFDGALGSDFAHLKNITDPTIRAHKQALSTSGCVCVAYGGRSMQKDELVDMADAVEAWLQSGRKEKLLHAMKEDFQMEEFAAYLYKKDGVVGYGIIEDGVSGKILNAEGVGYGTGRPGASMQIKQQLRQNTPDIAKVMAFACRFDVCSSVEHEITYGLSLNDLGDLTDA